MESNQSAASGSCATTARAPETPVPIEHPALLSTKARALARDTAERGGEPRATRADRARSPGPRGRRGGAGRPSSAPAPSCPVLPPGHPARLRLPAVVVPGVVGDGDRNAAVAADDRARGGVNTNRHIAVGAASAGGADVHHPVPIGPQSAGLQGVVHRSTGRTRPLRHTPNIVNTAPGVERLRALVPELPVHEHRTPQRLEHPPAPGTPTTTPRPRPRLRWSGHAQNPPRRGGLRRNPGEHRRGNECSTRRTPGRPPAPERSTATPG